MELKDKVVLITGSARRVGREIALTLASEGPKFAVHYRSSEEDAKKTKDLLEKEGAEVFLVKGDLKYVEEARKVVDLTYEHFGRLDVLINNAAIFYKTPIFEVTEKDWNNFLDVNLKAVFFTSQRAAFYMLKGGGGKIINIADWAALRPYTDYIPYCVSKGGIVTLTKALARTLAPEIQVNAVAPGPVMVPDDLPEDERQEILMKTPLRRFGSPKDIAAAVRFLIVGTDFATGTLLLVDGGRFIA